MNDLKQAAHDVTKRMAEEIDRRVAARDAAAERFHRLKADAEAVAGRIAAIDGDLRVLQEAAASRLLAGDEFDIEPLRGLDESRRRAILELPIRRAAEARARGLFEQAEFALGEARSSHVRALESIGRKRIV